MSTRRRTSALLAAGAIVVAVAAAGTAMARQAARAGHKPPPARGSAEAAAEASSPRVTSIPERGEFVVVTGFATGSGAEAARTLWYETVEGAAYAGERGATTLTRRVLDASGRTLTTETDPVQVGSTAADAPLTLSELDIASGAQERAATLQATVIETHYVLLFGGTAELVVQPNDPASFVQTAATTAGTLLGPLAHDDSPYLLTIVDPARTPLLVLGYTPGVGGDGQGIAWQAPGVDFDAILGMPVTVEVK